jgi:hypothetical protein
VDVLVIKPGKIVLQSPSLEFQNKIKTSGVNVYQVRETDQKIAKTWFQMDLLSFYSQLVLIGPLDENSLKKLTRRGAYVIGGE